MVFSSVIFLLYFIPIVLVAYHVVPRFLKNYVLLTASLVFYAWGAPTFVYFLVCSTLADFFIAKGIAKSSEKRKKNILLILSLLINIGALVYFKYSNFFIDNFNELFGELGMKIPLLDVILPIGISFYTFQTITYIVDVYRGEQIPQKNPFNYMLYIFMFPQLIAGPIVNYGAVAKDITDRKETYNQKLTGIIRFCIGLAKKVLIANVLGEQADHIFGLPETELNMVNTWTGALFYTMQIYFDFSGYSDMAIGLGQVFGFKFPENFDNPYNSRSITEFWRRWHITLGNFMKNYLYIPLGGNKKGKSRLLVNLMVVFLISGFWHGASWNFILWGIFHGFFLVLDRLFLLKWSKFFGVFSVVPTFIIVMIGWVLFRVDNLEQAKMFYSNMFFNFDFEQISYDFSDKSLFVLVVALFISFVQIIKPLKRIENYILLENQSIFKQIGFPIACFTILILCIGQIGSSNFNPFIYFRF